MKDSVTKYINSCDICQRTKYARKSPYVPLVPTETPSKPFQIVHIEVFTYDSKIYLILDDRSSKFAQALGLAGKTAIHTCNDLVKHLSCFGAPQNIIIDSGRDFCNETVKKYLNSTKLMFTLPPQDIMNPTAL